VTGGRWAAVCAATGALVVACGDNAEPPAVPLRSGPAKLELADGGSALVLSRDDRELLVFPADGFVIGTVDDLDSGASFDPYWLFVDAPPPPPEGLAWHAGTRLRVIASDGDRLVVAVDSAGATARVTVTPSSSGSFRAVVTGTARAPIAYLRVRPDADASEGFYGLGEWADAVEHRGKLRPMQIEVDLALESANNENHVPVPLLLGTRGWGLFVKSKRPGVFDVARETATRIDVTFGTGEDSERGLELHLFTAEAPLDLLRPYYDVTGDPGLPAPWAYGPLLWRDENDDQAQVLADIQEIRTRALPTSGIWFDRPYARGVNTFDWDPDKFPDPGPMLQALHDAGLRYGIWQAPYTAPAGNQDPAPDQHAFATASGFFPPVTGLPLNQWGKPIDFTNPAAYAWWQDSLRAYTDPLGGGRWGVEGFKLDYAEDVVLGVSGQRVPWRFHDGSDERTMHYGYTLLYHRIHRELLAPEGGFLLTRTGRWGDQIHGMIIWPGDLDASLAKIGDPLPGSTKLAVGGLPTALAFGIGLSASGFPFYASDTGGYRHSPPNNETWLRWVEANAVWSAMQVGDSSSQMPWEFTARNGRDETSVEIYRRYASLHLRLYPYAWSYATQMAETGRPIVRPFGLAYPALGVHPSDQYLFGEFLLSAPVIEPGATTRTLTLPPGDWLSWWDGAAHAGGTMGATITVPAPLDTLPLFVARGGLVPMLRPSVQTLSPVAPSSGIDSFASEAGVLWVRVAPGAPGAPLTRFTLYDGTVLTQGSAGTALGYTPGTVFTHGAQFELIAVAAPPSAVRAGGVALTARASLAALEAAADGWFHDPAALGGTLWIKVAGAASIAVE
jgi:alpha-D-xyloside xylohydrolase